MDRSQKNTFFFNIACKIVLYNCSQPVLTTRHNGPFSFNRVTKIKIRNYLSQEKEKLAKLYQ